MTECKICGFDHKIEPGAGKSAHALHMGTVADKLFIFDKNGKVICERIKTT